jgi:hypothetical protein
MAKKEKSIDAPVVESAEPVSVAETKKVASPSPMMEVFNKIVTVYYDGDTDLAKDAVLAHLRKKYERI